MKFSIIIAGCFMSLLSMGQTSVPKSFPTFYKIGHRGGTGLMPENTIPAMKKGIEAGANVVEVDIYTSKDGEVMVTHDAYPNWKIMLTPEGKEMTEEESKSFIVHQMDYAEVRKFDLGSKHYPPFPDQKKVKSYIPLLGELIDSVELFTKQKKLPGVIYNIELKTSLKEDNVLNSTPQELVDAVMAVVKKASIGDRFYIQSFDVRPLQYVKEKYKNVPIGYLVSNKDSFDDNIKKLGFVPHVFSPNYSLITAELIAQCKKATCKIVPWTVNSPEDIQKFRTMGVDGIITDYPNYLQKFK